MLKNKLILLIVCSLAYLTSSTQITTYNMSNQTVTDCEGILEDSEALFGGKYDKNEDFTFRICPGPGQITFNFSMLSLEPVYDSIMFYDGPTTSSPFIAGYTGSYGGIPPSIISTSGCMTIRFISDGTLQLLGWEAMWDVIADPPIPPKITFPTDPTCTGSSFFIEFDTLVHCDSIRTSNFDLIGNTPPNIINVTPVACTNDSTKTVQVFLDGPFTYSCEYNLLFDINMLDACDSLYSFTVDTTFTVTTCDIIASVSQDDDTICEGQCTNLNLTIDPGSCNTTTIVWSDGLPPTVGPHNVCPPTTHTYYVTVTDDSTGMQYNDSLTVYVTDTVELNLAFNVSNSNPPECDSTSFDIIFDTPISCDILDSGVFVLNSSYSPPTVVSATALNCTNNMIDSVRIQLATPLISNCNYYLDYTLNVEDDCNSINNLVVSDTFTLATCNLLGSVSYTDTVCVGNASNVTATINGCSTFTYTWSNGLPNSPGPHAVSPTDDTTFYLTITEDSTGLTYRDTVTIIALQVGVDIDMNINSLAPNCAADSIIVDFTDSVNCNALTAGQFTLSGGPSVPSITSVSAINCNGNYTMGAVIHLSSTFNYSCDYDISFNLDTVDECGNTVNLVLADTFRVQDCEVNYSLSYTDTICLGSCSNVSITSTGCFPVTYTWSNGLPNSSGPHNICPTADTTFSVIITDDSTGMVSYDTITIIANPPGVVLNMNVNSSAPNCAADSIIIDFSPSVNCAALLPSKFALNGGPSAPSISSVTPINCVSGNASGAVIYLSNTFDYSCDYEIAFDIDTVDLCGNNTTLTFADTFRIQDCEVNYTLAYNDTLCIGNCTNVQITPTGCFPLTYTWSNGLPNSPGPHNICPTGDTTFSVIITDDSTGVIAYDTITIVGNPPGITLNMNINASAPNCAADSIIVDFSPSINCSALITSQFTLNGGGPSVPTITSVTPVNCVAGEATGAILHLSSSFAYSCDYDISFDLDTVDLCGTPFSLTYADTFRVQDCEVNYTLAYNDTLCLGNCTNVQITPTGCFPLTYTWSNGLPNSPGPHNICPTTDTTFSVIITDDSTGVIAYDTIRIRTLVPGIVLDMSVNATAPNCAADSIILDFSPSVNCGALTVSQFTLNGGTSAPSITGVTPINCVGGEATGAIVYLSNTFDYNCDYDIQFDLDTVDLCGNVVSLTYADTFRIQDCEINYSLAYNDSVCIGNCSNVTITSTGCFPLTYTWSNGLPNSPGPHSICPTADTTFSVIITDDSTGVIAYDTIRITALTPGIILSMDVNTVSPDCAADSIILDFTPSVNCASLVTSRFTLSGGSLTPTITNITPVNCIAGEATGAIVYLSNSFEYNCDYEIDFNLDTVDLCGNVVNLTYTDTFRVQDCEINDTLTYTDTVCAGNCTNITYTATGGCFGLNYVWSNGLPNSPGPHNICPTTDTTFSVIITEDSTGIVAYDTIRITALQPGIILSMDINAVAPDCAADSIILDFTPSVNCASLTTSRFTFNGSGPNVANITSITPINCIAGEATGAIIYLDSSFDYNCDYDISFDLDTVDLCGTPYSLTYADTFRVQDCEINDTITFTDSICFGDCSMVTVTNNGCFGVNYVWSNGLPNSPGPHNICPTNDTTFSVIITENNTGVVSYDTISIEVDTRLSEYTMVLDTAAGLPSCDSVTIHLKFNKNILCDSIYLGAFTLTGSAFPPTLVNAYPTGCSGPNDSTNTATIVMANNFYGNCGYTINFTINSPTCTYTMGTSFNMLDCDLVAFPTYTDSLCNGECTNVSYTTNSCFPITYTWSNGLPGNAGPHNVCPNSDTTFTVTLTELFSGKVTIDTVNIRYLDAAITAPSNFCASDPATNLISGNTGGLWIGNGIINSATGLFDPSVAGAGTHKIKYTLLHCADSVMITVTDVEAGPNYTVCNDGVPFALSGYTPAGGTWTGPYVSTGGIFTPIDYGTHTVFYTYNGCTDSAIVQVDSIMVPYTNDTVCNYTPPFNISISPAGGTWSGTGITNASLGTFDPSIVPVGNNTVYYNYLTCMDSVTIYVTEVTLGNDTTVCPMQAPFNIPGATPAGGTWTGFGITNASTGTYDPAIIGNNQTDTIVYTYYGCTDTMLIHVIQTDVLVDTLHYCLNGSSVQLNNIANVPVTPSTGGVWTGTGVSGGGGNYFFNPNPAGVGVHTIYYNENTCIDSLVMVVYPAQLSYDDTTICSTHAPFMLDSVNNLPGVIWTGPGITNSSTGMINPASIPLGATVIRYTNPAANCVDSITVNKYQFVPAQIQSPDTLCFFNYDTNIIAIPPAGTWSGSGAYNTTNGTINPSTATQGNHQIIYSFGTGQCYTSDTSTIFVRTPLTANLTATSTQICPEDNTTLTASGSGGYVNAGYNYTWAHTTNTNSSLTVSPDTSTTYTITVTDGCSTPATASVLIQVYPIPNSTLTTSPTTCFGEVGYVTYDTNQGGYSYSWLNPPSVGDTNFSMSGDTVYVRMTSNFGCVKDTSVIIPTYGPIVADFEVLPSLPKTICLPFTDPTVTLVDNSIGGLTGSWNLGESTASYSPGNNITYTYENGDQYPIVLIIKNAGPCFDTATDTVCVINEPVFVPDIFSPNGDGANDILYARGRQIDKIEFTIFDRWGKQLFYSKNLSSGWDGTLNGKPANAGVYVYFVKALLSSGDLLELKGDVTLVR